MDRASDRLRLLLAEQVEVALCSVVTGPGAGGPPMVVPAVGEITGSLGDEELDRVVTRDARGEIEAGESILRHYGPRGEAGRHELGVFIHVFASAPRMIVVGAAEFATALSAQAKLLGFRVIVVDPRSAFATPERLPEADEIIVEWPGPVIEALAPDLGPGDAVCVLTHDSRFDVPAIQAVLDSDVGYVGVMGSRRTHRERVERLRQAGVDQGQIARLRSPVGLDIGARTPAETAVSICAEIIAAHTGASDPRPLRETSGPIHR